MMKDRILKLLLPALLICLGGASVRAQNVRQMWTAMPDSLCRYLNRNLRLELVELKEMGVKAEVKNLLEGNSQLDTLTADYLRVRPSKAMTMELRRLPAAKDSVYCLLTTWQGPAAYSVVDIYNSRWQRLSSQSFDKLLPPDFMHKPDTMTTARYEELLLVPDPCLVKASLSPKDNSLSLSLSLDLITKEERKEVEALLSERTLMWDGKKFK